MEKAMNKDGVTTAFEVILDELATVVDEVNEQGAQLFKNGKYDEATRLGESGKQLENFREKIDQLRSEWINGLDITVRNRFKIEPVDMQYSHTSSSTKSPKTRLSVTFHNGKIIKENIASKTFALALQEIGLDRVRRLSKILCNVPLISNQKHETYGQYRIGNQYIFTNTDTRTKKEVLEEIAAELGVKIQVEIIK